MYEPELTFTTTLLGEDTAVRVAKEWALSGDWELWVGGEFAGHYGARQDALDALESIYGLRVTVREVTDDE